jgi:hypothetical protein
VDDVRLYFTDRQWPACSLDTRSVRVFSLERHDDTAPEFTSG